MLQSKSYKMLSSFKTQKSIKEERQKQEFFEELIATINEELSKEEHQFLMTILIEGKAKEKGQTSTSNDSHRRGYFTRISKNEKESESPLVLIQEDVFTCARKKKKKRFITETCPESFMENTIVTSKIRKKGMDQGGDGSRVLTSIKKSRQDHLKSVDVGACRSNCVTSINKVSRYILTTKSSQCEKSILNNQKLFKVYNNEFLDNIFERHTHKDHSNLIDNSFADDEQHGRLRSNQYWAKQRQKEEKVGCISSIKFSPAPKIQRSAIKLHTRKF